MSIKKQTKNQLATSRTHSCTNIRAKEVKNEKTSIKQRQESLLQKLLQKKSSNSKRIFTDETTYTYKPQISVLPLQLYPQTRSQIQISKQTIVQRLLDNMKSKHQNFKLIKLKKEQQIFKETCSFTPQISQTSKAIILEKLKTEIPQTNKPTFERLYEEGLEQIVNRDKEYMSAQEHKLTNQHTFQPQINSISKQILNTESKNLQPIFIRFQQVIEKKRMQQKFLEEQKTKQIQSMANIKVHNKKTLELLQNNPNYQSQRGNVVKRLLDNYFKTKEEKSQKLICQQQQKIKSQCPFKPKINGNYLMMNASTFDPDQDFLDRQKQFQQAIKENIQNKANQLVPTFRPEINKLSQLICKERQFETLEEKLHRLHYEPLYEKQAQIEQLETSLYKQCKFHPQINQISKALQGPRKPHTCKCHPAPIQYKYIPEINMKSKKMTNNKSVQVQNRHKKQQITNKIKMEKEYNQLVQCTFQPSIKTLNKQQLRLNQNTADLVPGVREFVQNINKANLKKKQDEKYKDKVFNLEKRYKPKTNTTVKQFKLSHQIYGEKGKKALIDEAQQIFQKQHPFRPNIEMMR